jgi:hypothetical protein
MDRQTWCTYSGIVRHDSLVDIIPVRRRPAMPRPGDAMGGGPRVSQTHRVTIRSPTRAPARGRRPRAQRSRPRPGRRGISEKTAPDWRSILTPSMSATSSMRHWPLPIMVRRMGSRSVFARRCSRDTATLEGWITCASTPRARSQRANQKPSRPASKASAIRVILRPALTASSRQR